MPDEMQPPEDRSITMDGVTWTPPEGVENCSPPVSCYDCTQGCGSPYQDDDKIA